MADDIAGSGLSARRCKRRSTGDRLTLHLGRATLWAACVCAVGCASACASGCTPAPSAPRLSSPPAQEQATIMTSPTTLSTPAAPPGVTFAPAQLAALSARAQVPPRTRHLHPDGGPLYINRLAAESSPYLLQHAHNPVDWFPWGPEALARPAETRPADPAQRRLLRLPLVPRHGAGELRGPTIALHERALRQHQGRPRGAPRPRRALHAGRPVHDGGHGGWPMTVFLTPEGEPFSAAPISRPRRRGGCRASPRC
jgi:hypothetical protein